LESYFWRAGERDHNNKTEEEGERGSLSQKKGKRNPSRSDFIVRGNQTNVDIDELGGGDNKQFFPRKELFNYILLNRGKSDNQKG